MDIASAVTGPPRTTAIAVSSETPVVGVPLTVSLANAGDGTTEFSWQVLNDHDEWIEVGPRLTGGSDITGYKVVAVRIRRDGSEADRSRVGRAR